MSDCPHCGHPWVYHVAIGIGAPSRCQECGCMWRDPSTIPPPPKPRPARDELIATIEDVMWTELERQAEEAGPFAPYVDRDDPCIDGHPNRSRRGSRVTVSSTAKTTAHHCHSRQAINAWKQPLEGDNDE